MTPAQKFAKKYANYSVAVNCAHSIWHKHIGRIVGCNAGLLITIEIDSKGGFNLDPYVVELFAELIDTNSYLYLYPEELELLLPPPPILPDDCDTCGAVGEEKCKSNCPNREYDDIPKVC